MPSKIFAILCLNVLIKRDNSSIPLPTIYSVGYYARSKISLCWEDETFGIFMIRIIYQCYFHLAMYFYNLAIDDLGINL